MQTLRKHANERQDLALENSTAVYAMKTSQNSQLELGFSSASMRVTEAKEVKESEMKRLLIMCVYSLGVCTAIRFKRFHLNGIVFYPWIHSHILPSYAHANNGNYVFTS